MKSKILFLTSVASISGLAIFPTQSAAQDAATSDDDGVILVTANKRSQNIQEVALAIDALGSEDLTEQGISSGADLIGVIPNISSTSSNGATANFQIRGIGTNNFQGNVNRSIGIYLDDVTVAHAFGGAFGLFDQERVEVLRGPQNTLNGRNTTGGAINYISRKPTPGAGVNGYGRLTYGRFNRMEAEGALGFDITDSFALRIAGQTKHQDGAFTNIAPGREGEDMGRVETYALRGQALWEASDRTDILVQFRWQKNRGNDAGVFSNGFLEPGQDFTAAATSPNDGVPVLLCQNIATVGIFNGTQSPCVDIFGTPGSTNWATREVYNVSSQQTFIDAVGGTLRFDHDFGFAALTSITAYDKVEAQIADDSLGTIGLQFVPNQDSEHESFQQEVRLVSDDSKAFKWIVGAYYFREKLYQGINVRQDQNPINPNPAPTFGQQIVPFNQLDQVDEDISVYAQADFDVSDRLTISGGLRFTNNVKTAESLFGVVLAPINDRVGVGPNAGLGNVPGVPLTQFISNEFVLNQLALAQAAQGGAIRRLGMGPPPFIAAVFSNQSTVFGITPDGPELRLETNKLTGDFTVRYELSDSTNIYARFAHGFKSGAFDTRALAALAGTGADNPVGPETLNAYEIGLKADFASDVRLNASAFYYDQKDLQVFSVVAPFGPSFTNLPGSEVLGVEADLTWRPAIDTTISLAGSYTHSETTDTGGLPGFDQGHVLANTPKFFFSAAIDQDLYVGDKRFNFGASYRHISEQFDRDLFAEDIISRKPPQNYIDLRASLFFGPDEQYEFSIYGRNLTGQNFCGRLAALSSPLDSIGGIQNIAGQTVSADSPTGYSVVCQPGNTGTPMWSASFGIRF